MDQCANIRRLQFLLQGVPFGMAHHKQVPDRLRPFGHERQRQIRCAAQLGQIKRGRAPAPVIPLIKLAQFDAQKRSLQFIQAGVKTLDLVVILLC